VASERKRTSSPTILSRGIVRRFEERGEDEKDYRAYAHQKNGRKSRFYLLRLVFSASPRGKDGNAENSHGGGAGGANEIQGRGEVQVQLTVRRKSELYRCAEEENHLNLQWSPGIRDSDS